MIQVSDLSKSFGPQIIFEGLSFKVSQGERVGLVGRNGTGKSTLFKIILDEESSDGGHISTPKNYKIESLKQHLIFTKETVIEECLESLGEDEQFDTYKIEKILFGLGFTKDQLSLSPLTFSGGYQIRINLAKLLLKNPDMLLLDEPTNYLDIVSLRWLKRFLNNFPGEVILITHDRDFMDSVTTHTMGLRRGQVKKIKGDTAKYFEQVFLEDEIYEKTRQNQEKTKAQMEDFVRRFRAKASKATQAQSRLKQLEKMGTLKEQQSEQDMSLRFQHTECPGKEILSGKEVAFGYDNQENLFSNLNININRTDRIGIIGKNGKGKSTLLNVLGGKLSPRDGSIKSHPKIQVGVFNQTNIKTLSEELTVEQEIMLSNEDLARSEVKSICGAMMFSGELADKKISVLSGGERARVMLGKILAHKTNLLLLDEPTNHLDPESIESLTDAMIDYSGAILLVTHSELILRNVVNKLIVFHKGVAEVFEGTYDEFLEKIGWEEEQVDKKVKAIKVNKKEQTRLRQELIKERSKKAAPLKKKLETTENKIILKEDEVGNLNQKLIDMDPKDNLQEISIKLSSTQKEIESLFEDLESLSEEIDQISEEYDKKINELSD